jgi:hypothetical protein
MDREEASQEEKGEREMNWKLKAVLVKLENTALYFAIGYVWGLLLAKWHLLALALPAIAAAMAYEVVNYRKFRVELGGPDGSEQELFLSALDTYFGCVAWFLIGYLLARAG